jgi:hypothetical protein
MAYTNPGPAVTTGDTNIGYGSPDTMGTSTSSLISFYGVTPIVQRSGAAQATSAVGTASSADVTTGMKAALIEVMNTLTALGLWKGGA